MIPSDMNLLDSTQLSNWEPVVGFFTLSILEMITWSWRLLTLPALETSTILTWCIKHQAVYVPADDLTDPAPATTFAHLDATTVLSRAIAELGVYPAVDPLDSTSRVMDPHIIGHEHYAVARGVQKILQVSTSE